MGRHYRKAIRQTPWQQVRGLIRGYLRLLRRWLVS